MADSAPSLVLCSAGEPLPEQLARVERLEVDAAARGRPVLPPEPDPEAPALILYTSGTTGLPKGVVLPRRAIAANLDALAEVWEWTPRDVLVHGLPLFHAHGLVLGTLGPARIGCRLVHVGRFSADAVTQELAAGGTMLFAVPTMYHRLAAARRGERGDRGVRSRGRACSSRARRRCPRASTSASSGSAASASSSATGSRRRS